MFRFENQTFNHFEDRSTGRVFTDVEFVKCRFTGVGFSSINPANPDNVDLVSRRSTARNIRFLDCRIDGVGFAGPGIVEECVIDGLRIANHVQATGTVFKHVIVRGAVDKLMITPYVDMLKENPATQRSFDIANQEYYRNVDWALDISEGLFKDCDIRAVPARLIKRESETQVVLTREKAMKGEWRDLDLSKTYWPTAIDFFLSDGTHDRVLVAPKRARNFKELLMGLQKLKDAGVVEPD